VSNSTAGLVRALVDRGAADEAEALAQQALRDSTGTERAELLLALSVVQVSRGQFMPALAATVEAGELFQAAGLTARVCDALLGTAGTLRAAGDHDTALATLEHAEALARGAGDELQTGRVLRQIGIVSSIVGRHQHALSCLEEACAVLERHASADEQRNARLSLLNARNRRIDGQPDSPALRAQAEGMLQDWIDLAQAMSDAGQARLAVMAWGNHAITLQPAGRHREAADALRALIPRYQAYGMRPNEGLAHTELARCHETLGEWDRALHHHQEATAILRDGGSSDDLIESLAGLSRAHEHAGDLAAALSALKEVRAIEQTRRADAAHQALLQRELRVELARMSSQWARQAVQDPLTGLANRRALERWVADHWPRVEKGQRLAIVLLDLDHFKRINDTLGHDMGDQVLQEVAQLLKAQCRASDLAVRYGGEEFLLAMADCSVEEAAPSAERLRALIASQPWSQLAPDLNVTSSFGVADTGEALEASALFTLADRRLYAAKYGGRNRVVARD